MKTKLLKSPFFAFTAFIMVLLFTTNVNAQTLTITAVPDPGIAGSAANFSFNYTSSLATALYAELRIADWDGTTLSQNYANGYYVAGGFSDPLAVAATETTGTAQFNIPGNVMIPLPSNKKYCWVFKLTGGVNNYNDVGPGASTYTVREAMISASSVAVDAISFPSTPVATVMANSTQTISIQYTLSAPRDLKIGLTEYDASGNYVTSGPATYLNDVPATTTTPVVMNVDVIVPNDVKLTSALDAGHYYKWEYSYSDATSGAYLGGVYTTDQATIIGSLKTSDFEKQKLNFLNQNPVGDRLLINSNVDFKFATIYDMSGKKVIKITKASESTDVSSLKKGVYVIVTDTGIKTKFVKK
ncbi:T9SS type A sorting domain-containing protein [Flavobacterium restrictum]|uniref:T9SS type A sorting domain-containing protein n=1 Tax=Flavobacterium restrictum TaxID=2594428 RepID=A0A553EDG3_9FLAO|nr:T9SS type A sorting domain-containing protein [Flavobacterium restrictum]TRX42853.1 T9SS type A sorting domain-containing protein [Flavobacterium restrictum]